MTENFRKVASVVVVGKRLAELAKNRQHSEVFEGDGVSHIFTMSKNEADNGLTPLMLAARDNKLNIVEKLLELGASVSDRDKDGKTPLHYAAASGSDGIVKLLLSKKADATLVAGPLDQLPLHMVCTRPSGALEIVKTLLKVSGKDAKTVNDKNGCSPLHLAVMAGNQQVVKELLSTQPEQQVKGIKLDTKETVLHAAVRKKDVEIAKIVVESGCAVDIKNAEGLTALHIAAHEGDEQMIKYLYSVRADVNIPDEHDRTPLHIAAQRGNSSVAEFLVDKFKANVNLRTKDGSTLMHIAAQAGHPDTAMVFLKRGVPLHMPNKDGAVCLHTAARKGHVGVVRALLTKGAMVDAKTKDDYTALHIAVKYCKPQVVQTLLGFGANVQLKGGKATETPLHIGAKIQNGEKVVELLIKSGADVNAPCENGETAVHIAARSGNLKTLTLLIKEKADAARRAKNGETPLHHAVKSSNSECLEELVTVLFATKSRAVAKLVINMPTASDGNGPSRHKGETPLHYAAQLIKKKNKPNADTDIVRVLLKHTADCTATTTVDKETPLHYCARSGNNDILVLLLESLSHSQLPSLVNCRSERGSSPLLVASDKGNLDVVRTLLKFHARVDVFDKTGRAALHFAAERGHLEVGRNLLEQKAYVNAKTKVGLSPLHLAAENGHKDFVNLLVTRYKASVDALTLEKKTPLHLAAGKGQMEVCKHLLELRADVSAVDNKGQTALHYASQNNHSEVVALFLKHRPDIMLQQNAEGSTCAHIAAIKGSASVIRELLKFNSQGFTSSRNKSQYATPLLLAASGGHKEVVEVLIANGASASDEDAKGMTVLHLAAKYGHVVVLEVLRGKVPWSMASVKTGLTALHVAAQFGQIEVVREMLRKVPGTLKSESPSVVDMDKGTNGPEFGYTPLHLAAQSGHVGVVRILLNSPGVRVDSPTANMGSIPLHLAARNGHAEVVSILLSKSTIQLHVKDKMGRTALHLAASNGHKELVSLLIGQGADINAGDEIELAPIHMAADSGHVDVVKLLIESGASVKVESKDGKFPICFAASTGHLDTVKCLLQQEINAERLLSDKKFLFDLMVCSKMNNNESMVDFILQTPAPIYAAAKLSRHYRAESTREKERSRDLINAGNVCEILASELLSLACADGAETLLTAVDDREVPFLDVLIECEQKECVSHPSVQLYLGDVWRGNFKWEDWKLFLLFICSILCPLLWVFLCLPWNIKYHKVPIIKFVCHLVSHIYLILLFCLTTVVPWGHSYTDLLPHWYEWLLLIWLSGLLLSQLTEPHDRAGLGWIPILVLVLSVIGILLHLIAFAFEGYTRVGVIYARNQLFAVAMMFCFTQLLDFLSFHHLFGPWGVIIGDLMQDLVRFLVILLIFMTGFTAHLAAVYKPMYPNDSKQSVLTPDFGFLKCFELLFFSLFGLTEIQLLDPSQQKGTMYKFPDAMFILARFTFGVYNIITIVVLINLLIAMMSDTYQRIQAQSDIEWKFGRAKLIRNMKRSTATPSPLNVFTKFVTYAKILFKTKCKCCRADIIDILRTGEPFTESTSMDPIYRGSNSSWLPNGNIEHRENIPRIETVLDWSKIVKKFLDLRGSNSEITKRQMPLTYTHAMRERMLSAGSHGVLTPGANSGYLGRSPVGFGSSVSLRGIASSTIKKVEVVHGIVGKESD